MSLIWSTTSNERLTHEQEQEQETVHVVANGQSKILVLGHLKKVSFLCIDNVDVIFDYYFITYS